MISFLFRKPFQLIVVSGVALFGCYSSNNGEPYSSTEENVYGATIELLVDSPQIMEGNTSTSSLSFSFSVSTPSPDIINVNYVTVNGTAVAQKDFEYKKGFVSFNPGETLKLVEIVILGDQIDEIDEDLILKVSSQSNLRIVTPQVMGTILDDDNAPSISIGDASVIEGNTGIRKLLFPITLDVASGKQITVDFATGNSTATTPDDYIQTVGQLSLDPGSISSVVSVLVIGDTADEGDENLILTLNNETNTTLIDGSAIGTIVNDDPVSGLQQRPSNLTCIAPEKPTVNTSIGTTRVFAGIGTIDYPVALTQAPGDATQWYVLERDNGLIYTFENDDSASGRELFIDISNSVDAKEGESGLLGIAFHPDYRTNHFVFLSYTTTGPGSPYLLTSRLSRFESLDNGLTLEPSTEVVLLSQDQRYGNHNGGNIAFGTDGYLYWGLGDSGSAGDPGNRAQNTRNLFGTFARIDVDAGLPYGIPADNPFSGNPLCDVSTTGIDALEPCPEIYAWGFRNPWQWNFDMVSGVLWLADVGQNNFEEIDIVENGGNYGWRIQEGYACFNPSSGCDMSNLVQPILVFDHTEGQSITGGFVYRGSEIPELVGRYVFADFVTGKIFATTNQGDGRYGFELLADTNAQISSFGQDENGELYYLDYRFENGKIYRITQFGGTSNDTIPTELSDTGCVDVIYATIPAAGLIPYETKSSFWSDGAMKERLYSIPDSSTVDVDTAGDWEFPIGTVLVKNFRVFGSLVETRHFMRHTNGDWAGYTYEWNDDETGATRVIGGKTKDIDGQSWIFPSESQCMTCHTSSAGFSLGLEHLQLNTDLRYTSTGITANQLYTADAIDVLTDPLPNAPENMPSLAEMTAGDYVLDFDELSTSSYSNQDTAGNVSVEDNGATLVLIDNTWRKIDQSHAISTDTVLSFDFESTVEGEFHGIGFDADEAPFNDLRFFKLQGTQNISGGIFDIETYTGPGKTHYRIPVGQYYTGSTMYLVFVNDQDIGSGSDSRFSNVRIFNCPHCLDFNEISTSSYSNQDSARNFYVADIGATLVLVDNTWRKLDQTFTISTNTVLSFDFESTVEGEFHGIGFDAGETPFDDFRFFKLWGTQNISSGILDFESYTGLGQTHYEIPVGEFYTGNSMQLVLINDQDAGSGNDSRFSNVRLGNVTTQKRIRSYLHTNCSGCHRPFGPTQSDMDFRFDTSWSAMNVCDVAPFLGDLGVTGAKIVAPGDSSRSVLVNRMNRRDVHGMPPLGSNIVDTVGVNLLTTWIDSLTACPQ